MPMFSIGPWGAIQLGNHKSFFELYLNRSKTKGILKWFIYSLDKTVEYELVFRNNILESRGTLPKFVSYILNRNGLFTEGSE